MKGRRGVVLGGVSAGALILVRTANLLFPGALLLALLVRRVSAAHLALFVTCVLACIVPWQLRNWYAVHSLAVATQGGATLYMSHFRQPGQPYGDMTHDEVTARAEQMRDAEADRYLRAETLRRLRETPGVFFRAIPEKLVYFFAPLDWEILGAGRGRTWNPLYVLAMVLAALGGVSLWRTQRETLVMALLPIAYLAVIAALYYGSPRFRLPTEPPLLLLSAAGLRRLVSRA